MTSQIMRCLAAALVTAILSANRTAGADSWTYVVPPPGDPFEHQPMKALTLADARPPDLQEKVPYRGARRQYTRVHFGAASSLDVAVVLDCASSREADLYVDANRDRVIEAKERVAPDGGTWRMTLDAVVVPGDKPTTTARKVIFQLGRSGGMLRFAACGFLEGTVSIGGRPCTVRRTDGDANGFFADPRDRLWIDLNRDGRWDPIDEQFLYAPILVVGSSRYAVRSDALGTRLALEELRGTGTLKMALSPDLATRVERVLVTMIGRDASVLSFHGTRAEVTVPVGEYRPSAVVICVKDPGGGPVWNYVFDDEGSRAGDAWRKVDANQSVALDPIGRLELCADLEAGTLPCHPGDSIKLRPGLFTSDGLVIKTIYRGEEASRSEREASQVRISLTTPQGTVLDRGSSGFG